MCCLFPKIVYNLFAEKKMQPEVDEEFVQFFDIDVPVENRLDEEAANIPDDEFGEEYNRLKIQVSVKQVDEDVDEIKICLYDSDNLFFLYEGNMTKDEFEKFKNEQELEIDFNDFPNVLQEVLSNIPEDIVEGSYVAVLKPATDDQVQFIVKQDLDVCTTEIFNIKLQQPDFERLRKVSQQRYNEISKRDTAIRIQYKDLIKRIRRQDPKILQDFKVNAQIE